MFQNYPKLYLSWMAVQVLSIALGICFARCKDMQGQSFYPFIPFHSTTTLGKASTATTTGRIQSQDRTQKRTVGWSLTAKTAFQPQRARELLSEFKEASHAKK